MDFGEEETLDVLPSHPLVDTGDSKVFQVLVNSVPTNIIINVFANLVQIAVTQTNGLAVYIDASSDQVVPRGPADTTYTINVVQGHENPMFTSLARRLVETVALSDRRLLLCMTMLDKNKDESQRFKEVQEVYKIIMENKHW